MTALLLSLALAASPPLFDSLGTLHHPISSRAPLAQRYFDQGLRWNYGFNHTEAKLDFAEAARRDPKCAICLWGVALALKGDINVPADPASEQEAWKAIEKARAAQGTPVERAYVEALAKRYQPDVAADARKRAYADAMGELARAHPEDADAQALWAEAMLDLRPWDQWTKDGKPQPGTETLVAGIREALKRFPKHPGLNHFCIHALEESPHPEEGLACAERLGRLEPGAGHLVHMPAHIFMRIGRYDAATRANEHAIAADRAYFTRVHRDDLMTMMYAAHNVYFLWSSASMEGRSTEAIQAARALEQKLPVEMVRKMNAQMPGMDLMRGPSWLALARFGHWKELLAARPPPEDFKLETCLYRYALGMAHLRTGALEKAAEDLGTLSKLVAAVPADWQAGPANSDRAMLRVYQAMLEGELRVSQGLTEEGLKDLRAAVEKEDALGYDEPPPIYQPARHLLGAELLATGKVDEAIAVYRADLERNRENGWALFGLAQALAAKKDPEAKAVRARFQKAWRHADVTLTRSCF